MKVLFNFLYDPGTDNEEPDPEDDCAQGAGQGHAAPHHRGGLEGAEVARKGRGTVGIRDAAIIATLVGCGLRRGELAGLLENDVDLDNLTLKISQGKTGQREVGIPSKLAVYLRRYKLAPYGAKPETACPYFFRNNKSGVKMTPNSLNTLTKRLSYLAQIHLNPHLFRHTRATHFMSHDGAEILQLQALAGWTTLAMTKVYVKPDRAKLARSQEAFSPISNV